MTQELEDLREQVQSIKVQARELVAGKSPLQLSWQPQEGKWSMGECLDHLNITAAAFLPHLDRSIQAGQRGENGGARRSWLGKWMLDTIEPPPKRKFKAPKLVSPGRDLRWQEIGPRFLAYQDRILERLDKAGGLDLWKTKARHPAIPVWKFRLGELFAIMLAHERRHLWQAGQVGKAAGFPGPDGV